MRIELIGWKVWYPEDKTYISKETKWSSLPINGLLILKKFYKVYDSENKLIKDEKTGKDIFYELIYGHNVIALDIEDLKKYKKLPRVLKFPMFLPDFELKELIRIAEEDEFVI